MSIIISSQPPRPPIPDCSCDVPSTRRRILEAAIQLYRRLGYRKTTVADIARRLSMSSANIYRFFGSKRAIEEAVAAELLGEVIAAADAAAREGSSIERLRGALSAIGRIHASRSADDSKLYELVLTSMTENWPAACAYAAGVTSTIARIIAEGQIRDELPAGDPMSIACSVLCATCAPIHPFTAPACSNFAPASLGQMIDFCIDALCLASSSTKERGSVTARQDQ